ncbi:hypothetical protein ACAG09_30445, partial [Escherichia coli]
DRNRSHWSTSKTPSYTKSVSWQHHQENLSLHLTHTVKWTESLDTFLNMPTPVAFLEISNKPYLGNMLNDFAGVDQQRVMHCRKAFSDAKVFK